MSMKRKAFGAAAALCVLLGISAAAIALPKASKEEKKSPEEVVTQTPEQTEVQTPEPDAGTFQTQTPSASREDRAQTKPAAVAAVEKSIRALRGNALEEERVMAEAVAKLYAESFLGANLADCDKDNLIRLSDAFTAFVDKLSGGIENTKQSINSSFREKYWSDNIKNKDLGAFDIVSEWYKYKYKGLTLNKVEDVTSELMTSSEIEDSLKQMKERFDTLFCGMYDTSDSVEKYKQCIGVRVTLRYSGSLFGDWQSKYAGRMTLEMIKVNGTFKVIDHMDYLSEGTVTPVQSGVSDQNTEQLSTTQSEKTEQKEQNHV